jgi:hypothetical protein
MGGIDDLESGDSGEILFRDRSEGNAGIGVGIADDEAGLEVVARQLRVLELGLKKAGANGRPVAFYDLIRAGRQDEPELTAVARFRTAADENFELARLKALDAIRPREGKEFRR